MALMKRIAGIALMPIGIIAGIVALMLPTNWIVQRTMIGEAKRIAKFVAETYPVVKAQDPHCTETEVIQKVFFDEDKLSRISEESRNHIERCCLSIEGACYMMAMDAGRLKGFMTFRCLQFTKYMDAFLYARGFNPQSRETKEAVLEELGLLIDGLDRWC